MSPVKEWKTKQFMKTIENLILEPSIILGLNYINTNNLKKICIDFGRKPNNRFLELLHINDDLIVKTFKSILVNSKIDILQQKNNKNTTINNKSKYDLMYYFDTIFENDDNFNYNFNKINKSIDIFK